MATGTPDLWLILVAVVAIAVFLLTLIFLVVYLYRQFLKEKRRYSGRPHIAIHYDRRYSYTVNNNYHDYRRKRPVMDHYNDRFYHDHFHSDHFYTYDEGRYDHRKHPPSSQEEDVYDKVEKYLDSLPVDNDFNANWTAH